MSRKSWVDSSFEVRNEPMSVTVDQMYQSKNATNMKQTINPINLINQSIYPSVYHVCMFHRCTSLSAVLMYD